MLIKQTVLSTPVLMHVGLICSCTDRDQWSMGNFLGGGIILEIYFSFGKECTCTFHIRHYRRRHHHHHHHHHHHWSFVTLSIDYHLSTFSSSLLYEVRCGSICLLVYSVSGSPGTVLCNQPIDAIDTDFISECIPCVCTELFNMQWKCKKQHIKMPLLRCKFYDDPENGTRTGTCADSHGYITRGHETE